MAIPTRHHPFVFVSGGCRSGKSAYAQRLAESWSERRLFVATAYASDDEMRERVRKHQEERGEGWRVYEVPPGEAPRLWERLPSLPGPDEVLLLDCLTLWAAGCMEGDKAPKNFADMCRNLLAALWNLPCPVVLVSSEVGMGLVPESPAGRAFRDMAGLAAQQAAALATHVAFMVCGIPIAVKGEPLRS